MSNSLLNNLTQAQFLRRHWQKKPLLARASLPQFAPLVSRRDLLEMAQSPDTEARLIIRDGRQWRVTCGPFRKRDFTRLPARNWTLLVQCVNHVLPAAQDLLDRFAFIPYARLDDLMVSYAPPGGGVGPHFDSYDVFLLQGEGRRQWQISRQRDLTLVENAPLKILRNFHPTQEWKLSPGDMLYLPPNCAHDGIALEECITYSVGFRAPSAQELCSRFLDYLQDNLQAPGRYTDPHLKPAREPGRIDRHMVQGMMRLLRHAQPDRAGMLRFIGEDLSTPKPHVVFTPPQRPQTAARFALSAARGGLRLAPQSILLYDDRAFYVNGEHCMLPAAARPAIRRLADRRRLAPASLPKAALETLYMWYRSGYLEPGIPE